MPIHVFDLINNSSGHVTVNLGTVLAIANAFPGTPLHVHGATGHLAYWRNDPALASVCFHEIEVCARHGWQTHLVSFRRFWHDFRLLRDAIAANPRNEPCLIFLLCASSTAVHAAALLARIPSRLVFVQVNLHGNLNDALSWRSRNPIRRAFDYISAFQAQNPRVRFIVLEDAVRDEMARRMPDFVHRCDVMHHTVNTAEAAGREPPKLEYPIRIGLVGNATEAKGLHPFLRLAARFTAAHGAKVEFHIVGGRPGDTDADLFRDIAHPVTVGHIPRAEFVERMGRLHYVLLPLDASYYLLSPSGGLTDAIAWGRPILATPLPLVLDLFRKGGDIGRICGDVAAFEAALEEIIARPDAALHARQAAAMLGLARERSPEVVGENYRQQTLAAFPELSATSAPGVAPLQVSA